MAKHFLKIGNVTLDGPFLLAPLAGITDKSMRSLCREQGASLTYTEMVSAKGLWYKDKKTESLLEPGEGEDSLGFQIFGSEPEILGFAAKYLAGRSNPVLDLNVGCPVPKVVKNGEGSALLKRPELLAEIIRTMVQNAGKPVTAKIRMGFARGENTAVETARLLEDAGVSAITVHGRTREQFYEGKADWSVIAAVKRAVSVPVIGNGDVFSGEDAVRMMEETGCDGVMIARGALGNPWIFRDAKALAEGGVLPPAPDAEERILTLCRHIDMCVAEKGELTAVRQMRKHVGWYVKGIKGAAELRRRVNQEVSADGMKSAALSLIRG